MKKVFSLLCLASLFFLSDLAHAGGWVEFKAAYFFPTGHLFRKVYGGGGMYSFEATGTVWSWLDVWASVGYLPRSGHSVGGHTSTHLTLVPIGLGLKGHYPFSSRWTVYGGLGAQANYVNIRNHSHYLPHSNIKWGAGGIAKFGFLYKVGRHLTMDFFADYSYCRISFPNARHGTVIGGKGDFSGVSLGLGLCYRF